MAQAHRIDVISHSDVHFVLPGMQPLHHHGRGQPTRKLQNQGPLVFQERKGPYQTHPMRIPILRTSKP